MLNIKQTENLYNNSYLSYIASWAGALLVCWLLWPIAPNKTLIIWFSVFSGLTIVRLAMTVTFNKKDHAKAIDNWMISFLSLSFVSGTLWGLTAFILIPATEISAIDSIIYHGMLLMFIAVLIAGSLITYSTSKMVFLSFAVPAVVPQCLMLIAKGDKYHSFLGGFMLAYALVVFIISIYIHRMFSNCCKIEAENEALKAVLAEAGINFEPDSEATR